MYVNHLEKREWFSDDLKHGNFDYSVLMRSSYYPFGNTYATIASDCYSIKLELTKKEYDDFKKLEMVPLRSVMGLNFKLKK